MSSVLASDNITPRGTARQDFLAAFQQLARESNVDNISIQKICDRAGYCRKHYYNLFNNKKELIELSILNDMDTIARNCDFPTLKKLVWHANIIDNDELSKVVNKFIEYCQENPSYYRNILESSEGHLLKSANYSFISQFFMTLTSSLLNNAGDIILNEYLPSMMAYGLLSIQMTVLECCAYERDLEIPLSTLWVDDRIMVRSLVEHRANDAVSTTAAHILT